MQLPVNDRIKLVHILKYKNPPAVIVKEQTLIFHFVHLG